MKTPLFGAAQLRCIGLTGLCAVLALGSLRAQTAPAATAPAPAATLPKEEVVTLSPFNVSAENADRYRAGEAISAVRVRSALIDTPSSISVITRDMMDDLQPNRMFDVTRYIAGVQEGRGIQFQDRMIIRGFETQNGARTVDNFLQSADADNIDESVVDRIEVTKGPNAILSPAGAPGGSLNIITKSPKFTRHGSITAQIGMFDAQKATLDMGGPFAESGNLAYRIVASGQDTARYWDSDMKLRGWAIAPMISWKITDTSMLTIKYIAAEHWIAREPLFVLDPSTTATSGEPKLLPGIDPSGLNGVQPWSHVGTNSQDVFAIYTAGLGEHWNLRAAANTRRYHEDSDQNFIGPTSNSPYGLGNRYDPKTGILTQDSTWALQNTSLPYNATTNPYVATFSRWVDPTAVLNRGDNQDTIRETDNFQLDLAGTYQLGGVSSQSIFGYAYSQQDAINKTRAINMPNINVLAHKAFYPVYPADWSAQNGSSYKNQQYYFSERLGLFKDRLFLTGGILNYATVTKTWNAITNVQTGILDDNKDMWSAGALFKIKDNISVYYSHSTNASPVIANLLPLWREGLQDEIGVKTEYFEKRLSINAAYFEISQTNVTVPNPAYQTDTSQPQQLISDLDNKGFEVEVMGRVTPQLSAIVTYSHLKMRDSLGRMVRAVADDTASMLLNYRFDDGSLKGVQFNFGLTYVGKRAGDVPDGNFTQLGVVKQVSFYLEPQYTTMASATWRMNKHWSFRLNLDNLLNDADYISVAGGRITGTGLTTQPGFNARFTTQFDF